MKLLILLGNPGREYALTRHNAGRLLADYFSFGPSLSRQEKFKGRYSSVSGYPGGLVVLEPDTFMNLSGESVQTAVSFYKLAPEDLFVAHDDLELPFGTVGFRLGGGLGGHNGLRSIVSRIGSDAFYRFRIGISRPQKGSPSAHVLGRFSAEEEPFLTSVLGKAAGILEECLREPAKGSGTYKKFTIL